MADQEKTQDWVEEFWYSGKVTRRRLIGYGRPPRARSARPCWCRRRGRPPSARPSPTRSARCSRCRAPAAAGGKTALVGTQMAVDRINKSGGINGRPIELIVADYESKPDVGRRKAEKLVVEDKIDVHVRAASSPTSASPACRCSRSTRSST